MPLFGKYATDRAEGINFERMRNYRLKRAVDQMNKDGLGCLVTWDAYTIRYLTSVYATVPVRWNEGNSVILMKDGSYYVDAMYAFDRSEMEVEMPWLKGKMLPRLGAGKRASFTKEDVQPLVKKVGELMAQHGVTKEPLGLDGSTSELLYHEAFKDVGIEAVDAKLTMFEARKIKNQDEIECHRIAAANADAAFADIVDAIRPGIRECDLVGIGMKRLYQEGADETMEFVCASGQRTNSLHIDYTDKQILAGDLVIIDINGNSYQGYKSCYYRTFCCGKATAEQKALHKENVDLLYGAMNAVKAGNTTWDVASKWPDSPKYWGFDKWEEVYALAVGHGIGIPLHEIPFLSYAGSKAEPIVLEEGMVLALETWAGRKGGKFGDRLEEDLVVTKDGYDLLTKFPVDELIECWR
jgi:Xaa-Pro aminopeptidase